jgi:hypothetical protein
MKSHAKNRRHQTAYEAPEVEGEFLNESADTMLSASDSLGNLTSGSLREIDAMLLEEFNEDQGSRQTRPVEEPKLARKRGSASSSRRHRSTQADDRSDGQLAEDSAYSAISNSANPSSDRAESDSHKDLGSRTQSLYREAQRQGMRFRDTLQSRPYLLALGAATLGFALAQLVPAPDADR